MKARKVRQVIRQYSQLLEAAGVEVADFPHDQKLKSDPQALSLKQVRAMLPKMMKFTEQNQMAKVYRWLGFVQGVLWANGLISIGELREDNLC